MKTTYIQPAMLAVTLQHKCQILSGSEQINNVDSNAGLIIGGVGTEPARVKDCNLWDEEW